MPPAEPEIMAERGEQMEEEERKDIDAELENLQSENRPQPLFISGVGAA